MSFRRAAWGGAFESPRDRRALKNQILECASIIIPLGRPVRPKNTSIDLQCHNSTNGRQHSKEGPGLLLSLHFSEN